MTKQGLNELRELTSEVDELREKATRLMVSIIDFYEDEEDVESHEAYSSLRKTTTSMQEVAWNLERARSEMQKARKAESTLMNHYEGLINKLRKSRAEINND